LLQAIQRDPFSGVGKPEALRGNYADHWSRRITKEHRLIYLVKEDEVIIIGCRFHYDRKKP
jgi:toxin YoeB